jgi:hypothetical protein
MVERTNEQRRAELREAARAAGLELTHCGAGVFDVPGAICVKVLISVNHDDVFYAVRKLSRRWRKLGRWKDAESAIRAASYYTDKPIPGWRPRRF